MEKNLERQDTTLSSIRIKGDFKWHRKQLKQDQVQWAWSPWSKRNFLRASAF
jgi:hypothetical protein